MKRRAVARKGGFTLIEMMVVISIILILLAVAVPIYSHSIARQREQNLRQNLETLNRVIVQYTLDKQKPPMSLQDLQQAGYIKTIPEDITGREDSWEIEACDGIMALEQTETEGICGVKSGSNQTASDGTAYSSW